MAPLPPKLQPRWLFLFVLVGVSAGTAAALFLHALQWVTELREANPALLFSLPFAGFLIGALYWHFGQDAAGGNTLITEEIHEPRKILPLKMAPLVFIGTLLTHLSGGSAGREGTVVQMGASLADQLGSLFRTTPEQRKILLTAGAGAGFGAALGAPLAGIVFGMEVIHRGKFRPFGVLECAVASLVAFFVTKLLAAPHSTFLLSGAVEYSAYNIAIVAAAGCVFGLADLAFSKLTHVVESLCSLLAYPPLRPLAGGVALLALFWALGSLRYAGLGLPVIQESLAQPTSPLDPLWKSIATALTVGSGFKGGEFVPLLFIGATLGNALGQFTALPILASLGLVALFAGAANTPLACALMAMEIFGPEIGPYALLACLGSYYCSGSRGIYHQRAHPEGKFWWLPKNLKTTKGP